jgi:hypothetical protein
MADPAPKTEPTTPAESKPTFTNAQLAKLAKGTTVRVFDLDKDGNPKVDKETKQKIVVTRDITADDIFSHRIAGNTVRIVTVDGQKVVVPA